jgi:hypothetical protein
LIGPDGLALYDELRSENTGSVNSNNSIVTEWELDASIDFTPPVVP